MHLALLISCNGLESWDQGCQYANTLPSYRIKNRGMAELATGSGRPPGPPGQTGGSSPTNLGSSFSTGLAFKNIAALLPTGAGDRGRGLEACGVPPAPEELTPEAERTEAEAGVTGTASCGLLSEGTACCQTLGLSVWLAGGRFRSSSSSLCLLLELLFLRS